MKNKISLIKTETYYCPKLRQCPLVETVIDALLMYHLESLFAIYPDGFSKFLKPNNNPSYEEGNSWEEELAFSEKEFRTAFTHIGTAHLSKQVYDKSEDKFMGKYYCSYYDRTSYKTYYFRNNQLVDHMIDLFFDDSF